MCLVDSRYSKDSVTGTECVRGKMVGDWIREKIMGPMHAGPFESCQGLWILFWRYGQHCRVLNRGVTQLEFYFRRITLAAKGEKGGSRD